MKPITPGKAIFKVMKQVLNLHIILQPELAELLPLDDSDGGDELDYRLRQLVERIEAFRAARPQSGREVPVQFADGVQMQDENPQSGRTEPAHEDAGNGWCTCGRRAATCWE